MKIKEGGGMDIQNNQIQELFEKLYVKNAPSWALERDSDGSYKYHATQSAFSLFEQQQAEIELLKSDLDKAQAVPEWISTSDRMPEEGEEVLVHSYGQVRQATRDSSWAGGFKERNCYGWQATYGQSHWMPKNIVLPEQYHFYYENDAKQKAMIDEVSQ